MELAIPLVALGGLYIISNQSNKETFESRKNKSKILPNTDVQDNNYSDENPTPESAQDSLTSKLSTVNRYTGTAYTDKYFDPNSQSNIVNKEIDQNNSKYYSLSGQKVDANYFKHNNMQPFFGSHMRGSHLDANSSESILDNYTGSGSQIITKQERAPLFSPKEGFQYPFGMPNTSDFMQSRVNPSLKMSNVKPFQEELVAPGVGAGYGTAGVGGFNSGLIARDMYMPRNVDEMRADNHPKAGELMLFGHEGPADSFIKERAHLGIVEKNRVETSFPLGHERLFTTVGVNTAPTARAIPVTHHVNRPETSIEYTGAAGMQVPAQYMDGEYMPSKHIDLEGPQFQPAYRTGAGSANESDYGMKSQRVYNNNRSSNQTGAGYLGVAGGVITAAVAPLLDVLRPSRKENAVGTLRPYQNPGRTVPNSYIFNPTDRMAPTIRETTEISTGHLFVDRMKTGGAYEVTEQQPVVNNRQTQSDFQYTGVASAGERGRQPRTYDAEYNQRNNDLKSSTLAGYTPGGKNGVFNPTVNMTAMPRDSDILSQRELNPTLPPQSISVDMYGRQTTGSQLHNTIQLDRTNPDILSQLKGNPFVVSHLNGL